MGVSSPVRTRTPTYYLDFEVEPGASHSQLIPEGWTTFAYTLDGESTFEGGTRWPLNLTLYFTKNGKFALKARLVFLEKLTAGQD